MGLKHSFVDMRNIEDIRKACRPETKLFWLETPTNPLIEVVDIRPVAECARSLRCRLPAKIPSLLQCCNARWSWARTWWFMP